MQYIPRRRSGDEQLNRNRRVGYHVFKVINEIYNTPGYPRQDIRGGRNARIRAKINMIRRVLAEMSYPSNKRDKRKVLEFALSFISRYG